MQLRSYQGSTNLPTEGKRISGYKLISMKVHGCYYEFGFKETMRRIAKEILRRARTSVNGLDISIITDKLAIGASPKSDEAIKQLLILGFKHVIDLRAERRQSDILVSRSDISVSWVPTYDNWKPKPDEFFSRLANEVNSFFSAAEQGKLFICCGAGEHRAPLAGVLALVNLGYSLEAAAEIIQKARPQAELLPVYMSSLKQFLESTCEHNS